MNVKKGLLLSSASTAALAAVFGTMVGFSNDAQTALHFSCAAGSFGLLSMGLFFVGVVFPKD